MENELKSELITEGSALVARFMGLEENKPSEIKGIPLRFNVDETWLTARELKYDTSWDWLIPVVHKILKATEPTGENGGWSYEYIQLENTRVGNSIDYVYMKVVEFIKRYNSERGGGI